MSCHADDLPEGPPHDHSWAEPGKLGCGDVEGRPRVTARSGCARSTGWHSAGRDGPFLTADEPSRRALDLVPRGFQAVIARSNPAFTYRKRQGPAPTVALGGRHRRPLVRPVDFKITD